MDWSYIIEGFSEMSTNIFIAMIIAWTIISPIFRDINCWRIHISRDTNIVCFDINDFRGGWVESTCVSGIVADCLFKLPWHVLDFLSLIVFLQFILKLNCTISLFYGLWHLCTYWNTILFRLRTLFFRRSSVLVTANIQFALFNYIWNILIHSHGLALLVIRSSDVSLGSFAWLAGILWCFFYVDCFLEYLGSCVFSHIWRISRWVQFNPLLNCRCINSLVLLIFALTFAHNYQLTLLSLTRCLYDRFYLSSWVQLRVIL